MIGLLVLKKCSTFKKYRFLPHLFCSRVHRGSSTSTWRVSVTIWSRWSARRWPRKAKIERGHVTEDTDENIKRRPEHSPIVSYNIIIPSQTGITTQTVTPWRSICSFPCSLLFEWPPCLVWCDCWIVVRRISSVCSLGRHGIIRCVLRFSKHCALP